MAVRKGHNIANGVISAFVLVCGISFSVLVSLLLKKLAKIAADIIHDTTDIDPSPFITNLMTSSSPVWALGFAYIIPGLFGVISAVVRQNGMYIAQMVFCIITLLVMGIFFLLGIFALSALAIYSPGSCLSDGNVCKCGGDLTPTTFSYTCKDLASMYRMGVSILVIIVLAWILALTSTILAGILACRRESPQQPVINQPMPPVVQFGSHITTSPQVGYIPQTHDNAQLINNMQYSI